MFPAWAGAGYACFHWSVTEWMCAGFCCPTAGVVTVSMPNRPMEFNNDFSVCLEPSPTTQRVKCMLCKCGDQSVYPQKPHKADAVACSCPCSTHTWEETQLPEALWASQPGIWAWTRPYLTQVEGKDSYPRLFCDFHRCALAHVHTYTHIYHTHTR